MEVDHNNEAKDDENNSGEFEFVIGRNPVGEMVGDFLMKNYK